MRALSLEKSFPEHYFLNRCKAVQQINNHQIVIRRRQKCLSMNINAKYVVMPLSSYCSMGWKKFIARYVVAGSVNSCHPFRLRFRMKYVVSCPEVRRGKSAQSASRVDPLAHIPLNDGPFRPLDDSSKEIIKIEWAEPYTI
jgi:hypothetical protein